MSEIKNIIFDMGRVLLQFDPYVSLNAYCTKDEDKALIYKELFKGPEWIMGDEGKITNGQRYELVKKRIPSRLHRTLRLIVENWSVCMEPLSGAQDFVKEVQTKGYHTYILSNACNRFYQYFPNHYDLTSFDDVIVSADVHMIKPNPAIYHYLLTTNHLTPSECLFIDDMEENIRAAEAVGIRGIVFDGDFNKVRNLLYYAN